MRNGDRQRGFTLVFLTLVLFVIVALLGVGADLGYLFIVKSDLRARAQTLALTAVARLDGTPAGILAAEAAVAGAGSAAAAYATDLDGTYDSALIASGSPRNRYRFVRVTASGMVPFGFLPALSGLPREQPVNASAVAGQQPSPEVSQGGLAPFSPAARDPADTASFGFVSGTSYPLGGYVDLGQGPESGTLRRAVVFGDFPKGAVSAGTELHGLSPPDEAALRAAVAERARQDTDQTALTWEQYKASAAGNGRRAVTVAIRSAEGAAKVLGFGKFLLEPASAIEQSAAAISGTYIGPANLDGAAAAGSEGSGVYRNVLLR